MPAEVEIGMFCDARLEGRRAGDVVLIKILLYPGVRVGELVRIRLADVDLDACRQDLAPPVSTRRGTGLAR